MGGKYWLVQYELDTGQMSLKADVEVKAPNDLVAYAKADELLRDMDIKLDHPDIMKSANTV